jgi:hypothetical protein
MSCKRRPFCGALSRDGHKLTHQHRFIGWSPALQTDPGATKVGLSTHKQLEVIMKKLDLIAAAIFLFVHSRPAAYHPVPKSNGKA